MKEERIEQALKALGSKTPKAPKNLVNNMLKTVKALGTEKEKRAVKETPAKKASAERSRKLAAAKPHKAPSKGMKK